MLTIQDSTVYFGSASPESGSGAHKETALLSITNAPAAPFAKGSKYFRNEDGVEPELNKKIYTAVADGTWDGAKISEPVFGAYYTYNGDTYTWDGDSLQIFELEDYQLIADKTDDIKTNKTSSNKYPSTKGVHDYFVSQGTARNFTEAGITKITSSYTFLELAEEIRGKQFATGTTLYGEVRNSGMPTGIGNAEVRVEVLETKSTVNPSGSNLKSQVIEFTLFSTDIEPKEWTFIYYDQRNTQWVWVPKDHIVIVDDITMFQIPNAPLGSELPLPVLDDITIPGEYTIRFDLSDMEPGALLIGNLIVSNAGLLSQKYTCEISGATFILTRQQESNTWTPWFCISGLNNFFTPANLVAGTNLQITHAADESGYDKYTVGTTDKVWTQDNLIAGNNITFEQKINNYIIDSHVLYCFHFNNSNVSAVDNTTTVPVNGYSNNSTYAKFLSSAQYNDYGGQSNTAMMFSKMFSSSATLNSYELTIDFWAYIDSYDMENNRNRFIGVGGNGWNFSIGKTRDTSKLSARINIGGGESVFELGTDYEISSFIPTDNIIHHYALCIDSNRIAYYYVDGEFKGELDISNIWTSNKVIDRIVTGSYYSSECFIDELRISNICRWGSEYKNTGFAVPTTQYEKSQIETYSTINAHIMTGATSLANGVAGVVPAPAIADKDKYLKGDGSWSTITTNTPLTTLTPGVSALALATNNAYSISLIASQSFTLPTPTATDVLNKIILEVHAQNAVSLDFGLQSNVSNLTAGDYVYTFIYDNNSSSWKSELVEVEQTPSDTVVLAHFNNSLENLGTAGTLTAVPNSSLVYQDVKFGGGVYCNTTNNAAIKLPDSEDLDFGTGDFTIDAWVYVNVWQTYIEEHYKINGCILSNNIGQFGNSTIAFMPNNFKVGEAFVGTKRSGISSGNLYHIAVTRSNGTVKLFKNGEIAATDTTNFVNVNVSFKNCYVATAGGSVSGWGVGKPIISELHLVKGRAIWTEDFSSALPAAPYTLDATVDKLQDPQIKILAAGKQDVLTAGAGINIASNTISTTVPTLTWYTNNTTASITIVDTSTARLVKVYYNGVLLQPTEDYTINGTTLTFIGNVLAASDKVAVEVFN